MSLLIVGEAIGGSNIWKCVKCDEKINSFSRPRHTCKLSEIKTRSVPVELPFSWSVELFAETACNAYRKTISLPETTWEVMNENERIIFMNISTSLMMLTNQADSASGLSKFIVAVLILRYYQACDDIKKEEMERATETVSVAMQELLINLDDIKEMSKNFNA